MTTRAALAAVLAALLAPAARGAVQLTRRERSEVREGPGNYYPLACVLGRGSSVSVGKSEGGWLSAKGACAAGKAGWLSKNCFAERSKGTPIGEMRLQSEGGKGRAGAAAVAAAVRGFALRVGHAQAADLELLASARFPAFSPSDYAAFKAQLRTAELPSAAAARFKALFSGYQAKSAEEGVGMAVAAAVLAKEGLDPDERLRAYANMLATALAEPTGAYDVPLKVLVTRSPRVNALAVPGGYVLLSRGLVSACKDEAELAAALAHELTHVFARHGVKELGRRETQIKADDAMDELDKASGASKSGEEAELEDLAEEGYDMAHKPRLAEYEVEADQGAALLLARAGYDVAALPRMIRRAGDAAAQGKADEVFMQMDFKKRAEKAEAFLQRELAGAKGDAKQARFEERMR